MPSLVSNPATSFFTLPFRRHKRVYEMNPPDETYSVTYLGNVLTAMGKGEASIQKPLNVIWRTYNSKKLGREISMKLSITRSGLKANTKQGTTDYWANRVTYCAAPAEYPRVFCWVYKHEGRRMKPDLRCHAVLCRKATEPAQICTNLNNCLHAALLEYKREKLMIEKARKNSLCGGIGPRRKIMLQTGSLNFRTPICRSKSAPRLGSIDEEDEGDKCEEDEAEVEELDVDCMSYHNTPNFNDNESISDCGATQRHGDSEHKPEGETSSVCGSSSIDSASSAGTSCSPSSDIVHSRGCSTAPIYIAAGSFDECFIDRSPLAIRSHSALTYAELSASCPATSSMKFSNFPTLKTTDSPNKFMQNNRRLAVNGEFLSRIDERTSDDNIDIADGNKQVEDLVGYELKKLRLNRQNSLDDSRVSSNSTTPDNDCKTSDV